MNFVNPSVELINLANPYNLDNVYKHIEYCGRTCYKSHDKITPDSAIKFVENMKKSGHGSVLEHGTIYLDVPQSTTDCHRIVSKYVSNKYSIVNHNSVNHSQEHYYVSTNLRVLVENGWLDDLQYICEPTEYHELRITFKFTADIGVTREFNRHRVNSPSEESTRYCNYSKDKFGSELSVALSKDIPEEELKESLNAWGYDEDDAFRTMCSAIHTKNDNCFTTIGTWLFANLASQWSYMRLIDLGWKPQQARRILPLDTKSELVHTAFLSDWLHFLSLRSPKYGAQGVHPDAAFLANKVYDILNEKYSI